MSVKQQYQKQEVCRWDLFLVIVWYGVYRTINIAGCNDRLFTLDIRADFSKTSHCFTVLVQSYHENTIVVTHRYSNRPVPTESVDLFRWKRVNERLTKRADGYKRIIFKNV